MKKNSSKGSTKTKTRASSKGKKKALHASVDSKSKVTTTSKARKKSVSSAANKSQVSLSIDDTGGVNQSRQNKVGSPDKTASFVIEEQTELSIEPTKLTRLDLTAHIMDSSADSSMIAAHQKRQ